MFKPLSVFNRRRNAPALRQNDDGDPFYAFHRDMNRLFEDFFSDFGAPSYFTGDGSGDLRGAHRGIHIDVKDKGKAFELEAELPGVDEDNIDVEINDNLLTISGEKKVEEENEDGTRRAYSSFHRSMSLPFDVDPDAIEATFKNGILRLHLPKPPELEAKTRKISVRKG